MSHFCCIQFNPFHISGTIQPAVVHQPLVNIRKSLLSSWKRWSYRLQMFWGLPVTNPTERCLLRNDLSGNSSTQEFRPGKLASLSCRTSLFTGPRLWIKSVHQKPMAQVIWSLQTYVSMEQAMVERLVASTYLKLKLHKHCLNPSHSSCCYSLQLYWCWRPKMNSLSCHRPPQFLKLSRLQTTSSSPKSWNSVVSWRLILLLLLE